MSFANSGTVLFSRHPLALPPPHAGVHSWVKFELWVRSNVHCTSEAAAAAAAAAADDGEDTSPTAAPATTPAVAGGGGTVTVNDTSVDSGG